MQKNKNIIALLITMLALSMFSINAIAQAKDLSKDYLQTTSLPTLSSTPSPTFTSTSTSTSIPTPTLTLTPTPSYPSVQDIKDGLDSDFGEIKDLLHDIKQQTEPQTFFERIQGDFAINFLWDFFGNPLIAGIFAFVGSLSVVGKALVKAKIKRDVANGNTPNETDKKLDSILEVISVVFVLLFVVFSLVFALNLQSNPISTSQNDLSVISQKLDSIENRLENIGVEPTPTPTNEQRETLSYYSNINWGIAFGLLLSVVTNILLVSVYSKRQQPISITETNIASQKISPIPNEKELLPAILLSLLLLLLPFPADTIILPFILQYFIFAFFGVVSIYSNKDIKAFTVRHYSKIIYWAEFGVWYNFINFIARDFLRPSWFLFERFFPRDYNNSIYIWLDSSWDFLPLIIALVLAIPSWVYLKEFSKKKFIPRIKTSLANTK